MRYKIELAYNGSGFHGWQKQINAISVQETIENALSLLISEKVVITGCGRTDTGVHAKYFAAHFDSSTKINSDEIVRKLNAFLGNEIVIYKISKTSDDFHARFSAKSRTYMYFIRTEKDPFGYSYSWNIFFDLNIDKMREAGQKLLDYTDFTCFSKLHTDVKTHNCKILNVRLIRTGMGIVFIITADRFLRNMVRAIVGTLVEVGKNRISVEDFCRIIESKDRSKAGQSAPAQGLFLMDVRY